MTTAYVPDLKTKRPQRGTFWVKNGCTRYGGKVSCGTQINVDFPDKKESSAFVAKISIPTKNLHGSDARRCQSRCLGGSGNGPDWF
jgi:hypothetical protein